MPEKRTEWRAAIVEGLQHAQQQGDDWQIEVDLYSAVLSWLDGQPVDLPVGHPYADAVAAIRQGVAGGGEPQPAHNNALVAAISAFVHANDWATSRQIVERQQEQAPELPFDAGLIPRSIAALRGDPSAKMALAQYLNTLALQSDDRQFQAFVTVIQDGLFGRNLRMLGGNLTGIYAQAWATIVAGIIEGENQE